MPHPTDKIRIPLKIDEALRLALQVKPTKDMPRPGAASRSDQEAARKRTQGLG
jgi:hypothetical protein